MAALCGRSTRMIRPLTSQRVNGTVLRLPRLANFAECKSQIQLFIFANIETLIKLRSEIRAKSICTRLDSAKASDRWWLETGTVPTEGLDRKVEHRQALLLPRDRQTDIHISNLSTRVSWPQTVSRQIGQSWAQDTRVRLVGHDVYQLRISHQANVREDREHTCHYSGDGHSVMHRNW